MLNVKTIGVIGAGQMGGGIALVAASNKFNVVLCEKSADQLHKCEADHKKRLGREVEKQRMQQADADAALKRIKYVQAMDLIRDCDFVVEAVVESSQVKRDIFAGLARMMREEVILATNTSSISITEIAAAAEVAHKGAGQRVIGMHFFNPVPVMKLVEVIKGLQTSEATTSGTIELAKLLGKTPVPANDRAGFVSNRVLMPLINEAFYAWMEGVAEPAHIDEIMKLGCNFPMGPLRLADFIGLDTCEHIMNVLADGLNNDRYRACPLLRQLVAAGRLGDKSGRGVFDYTQPAK
ncbi:MAG: 3-hydroxybutyryl-CoA dehydrogenase [Phycisphaerae bacterium]|nr:putative 3-hydroxybutyryl-CoA dehydrogenase [Phycisphaerales bacterium]MCK6476628.1 3-hydroxyacyl-CoA dehydrogenase NAD-binding domain-containing protein [Phycisphaerales bacterium]